MPIPLLLLAAALSPAQLPGVLFHAERFVSNAKVVDDPTALGGKAVRGTRWYYFCRQVPFPQGDGDYHVWLRVKTEGPDNPIQLGTLQDKNLKILAAAPAPPPGRWTWVRLGPLRAKKVGPCFAIHGGGQAASQWTSLDAILITRQASLSPEMLDQAAGAAPPQVALLAAPQARVAPIVDGLVDDECYRRAAEAFPFVRLGQPRLAQAQTRVWAAWDAANLYVAARLEDPVLEPAANRLGDFRKRVTQHDGPVSDDDCLEILIDPSGDGRSCYRFVVNALGTLYDARGQDKTFESRATARSRVAVGSWSCELSIPLASLGIAPGAGRVLGINLLRERYGQRETSCWSPSGRLMLAEASTGIGPRLRTREFFGFGENRLEFSGGAPGHMTALVDARVERAAPVQVVASGPADAIELVYKLTDSGRSTLQFLLIDDATGLPAYRSPLYSGEVAGTVAEVSLQSDGELQLFSNGERAGIAAGLPLVDGLNAIAVKTSGTTLSGRIRAGDVEIPVDATWRWTQAPDATSRSLDLDKCEKVAAEESAIRAPSPGGVFRKSIAVNATRAWPNYGEAMHLARGAAQWFHLRLAGIRGLPRANRPVVVIDIPEGIELVDAAGYYGNNRIQQPRFSRQERGRVDRDGRSFQRVVFRSDRPIRTLEQVGVLNLFSVTIRAKSDGPLQPGSEATLFYYQEDCDGAIVELPRALKVRIAAPLAGLQPKRILWQCWPGWLSRYDGDAGREALLGTIARAGFNDVTLGEDPAAAHRHGLRLTALVNFEPWVLGLAPYLKDHPADARVDGKGKSSLRHICPSRLLESAWDEFVDPAIGRWLAKVEPDHVNWDFESSAFTGELACYDARCLAAFRKFAGLPGDKPLASDQIIKSHRAAWLDFMANRSSQVAARFRGSIKKHRSAALFSMYSGYQCAETKEVYNVDWSRCSPHLDLVMCGYGRRAEEVADTRRAAGKTGCVFGCITHPYDFNDDKPATLISAAEVLRRLCDARAGVLFYDLSNADARTLAAFARVSRVAAGAEEFFIRGADDRASFKVIAGKADDVYAFSLGRQRLLCLVNETLAPARFEIECPAPPSDFFSGKASRENRLRVEVPAGQFAVFRS